MTDHRAASRYAKSILQLSLEKGKLEEVYTDMKTLRSVMTESTDFRQLLKSPIISQGKKQSIVKEAFANKLTELTSMFIHLLIDKGREVLLEEITVEFLKQYKLHKHILTATVTTASPLSGDLRQKIVSMVKGKTQSEVDLQEKVDPSIIGGFILQVGDEQIDSSIAGKLAELKSDFNKNPYVKEF